MMRSSWVSAGLLYHFVLMLLITGLQCQEDRPIGRSERPPRFQDSVREWTIIENTEVGTSVYQLRAVSGDEKPIVYELNSDYLRVNSSTGLVTLREELDYERITNFTVVVTIYSVGDPSVKVQREILVKVQDQNDVIPFFNAESFSTSFSEAFTPGSTVVTNILAFDNEPSNSELTVVCVRRVEAQGEDPCDTFRVQTEESSNRQWVGRIVTSRLVDYETRKVYVLPLRVSDGIHTQMMQVTLNVDDVDDTPPVFTGSLTANINETTRVGAVVMTFSATDGDATSQRPIVYRLASNPGNYFDLNPDTGVLVTRQVIDREGLRNSFITLQVEAIELVDGAETQDPNTRTLTQATVTVTDGNDNPPRFVDLSPSEVMIDEDIANGSPIRPLTVTDSDQGRNGQFRVILLTHNTTFEIFPSEGAGTLTTNIRIKDTNRIDFDNGIRTYVLRLSAVETQTANPKSSTRFVTVTVNDVNDNRPIFPQNFYEASVSELAPGGTAVTTITATDADSGIYGEKGLRYRILGNGADKFNVNKVTGEVTVKQCPTPGERNCLDAETTPEYNLIFEVKDNYAEGFSTRVDLNIRILDENDNAPRFRLGTYESFIKEGSVNPDPPINVQATDDDTSRNNNNAITYSIVGGNVGNLWQIGRTSGAIVASRPVSYAGTPAGSGTYTLTVQAADPKYRTTGTVRIHVRDTNNFPPEFVPSSYYEEYIPEDTPPGTTVLTVLARDKDAPGSPNSQVRYRIIFGAGGKFVIDPVTGVLRVDRGATFDYDVQNRYQLTVIAEDQGSPKRNTTATVVIYIRDANNKDPYFEPSSVRTEVYENVPVNTRVTEMTAKDPDSNAVLVYSIVEPVSAWGPDGQPVNINSYNYKDLFMIERDTGVVRTRSRLDRDRAAGISLTIQVEDTGQTGNRKQTATGTLIVDILDINDGPPTFPQPWTPNNPFLNISVQEELPLNFYVTTIIATDPYDSVVEYRIIQNPGNYFNIDQNTGVVTINRRIDYEQIQQTFFVVTARDDGRPSLTSTATVNVNVMNINDNNPTFTQDDYDIDLKENPPTGTIVTTVTATDIDLGEYGIVRYNLEDPLNRFIIDPITGVIRVHDGATLDREKTDVITVRVIAYDSPNKPNDRKSTTIPIYITLTDDNDHPPVFTRAVFNATILESVPVGTSVITLTATDQDEGPNAELTYVIMAGDGQGLFRVLDEEGRKGQVVTAVPLAGRSRRYNMTVRVVDGGIPSRQAMAILIVDVIPANNEAPRWIWPRNDNETVDALENQYLGIIVTENVLAVDDGEGANGDVSYGFFWNNVFVQETPNFKINPITGVITAKRVFDREARDTYTVLLVARDGGRPPYQSMRYLTIKIRDTDDHDPVFPQNLTCCTIPYVFSVSENLPSNQFVGEVKATDLDIGQNAETRYFIIDGDRGDDFYINETTGRIYTNKRLDHEVVRQYELEVRASNLVTPNRPDLLSPLCVCRKPSVVTVIIRVTDTNDFSPVFAHAVYNSCVAIDAPFDKSVLTVVAADPDAPSLTPVLYSISDIKSQITSGVGYNAATKDTFKIGRLDGIISTNALMQEYEDHFFNLRVAAADPGGLASNAQVRIWVTEPSTELKLTVRETPEQVYQGTLDEIVQMVSEKTNGGIVCVSDVRFHVGGGGEINTLWSDIILHVIDGNSLIIYTTDYLIPLLWPTGVPVDPRMEALLIENVQAANALWTGFIIDPILAAILLILLLLLLALLLLCCLCCCMKAMARRQARKAGLLIEPLMKTGGTCVLGEGGTGSPLAGLRRNLVAMVEVHCHAHDVDFSPAWGKFHYYGRRSEKEINPIWQERLYEDQELNMKLGTVGGIDNAGYMVGQDATARLALGGGEVSQTTHTTTSEYQMNYERTQTQQMIGEDTVDAGDVRIVAPLSPRSGASASSAAMLLNGGSTLGGHSVMADSATQVELMASRSSLRHPSSNGPSQIGARLHSYALELPQEVYSSDVDRYSSAYMSGGGGVHESYVTTWPRRVYSEQDVRHVDQGGSLYATRSVDLVDGGGGGGLYQGEIILGSLHPPQFPNHQQQETRYHTASRQIMYDDSMYH